jgi:AraC-like DNA-binding protein
LDALWGAAACDLRDKLLAASTPETRFRILEQSLLAHTTRPLVRHPAVSFALTEFQSTPPHPNKRPISDVSDHIGLSQRRFIQLFSDEVGLTPKLFCRVRRFQEVLRLVDKGQQLNWTDIALTCGYFDQAHFIHDFRDFSGLIPSVYLTRRGEHLNHVPLLD